MRIVHVEDYFNALMGYQVNNLAKLESRRNEVIIITSDSISPWPVNKEEIILADESFEKKYGVRIIRLKALFEYSRRVYMKGLVKTIINLNPDILFIHNVGSFKDLVIFRKQIAKCIVIDNHTVSISSRNRFRKIYYWLFRNIYANKINDRVDFKYSMGIEEKEYMGNLGLTNIIVTPHCVNLDIMSFSERARSTFRDNNNIPKEAIVMIYTGKFDYYKKPHLLLKVFIELINIYPNLYLVMVGAKNQYYFHKEILPLLSMLDKTEKVLIYNAVVVDELYKFYSASDIAIWPEETSLSCLDAQACGCATIMADYKANRYNIGLSGLTFNKNDYNDLLKKIVHLINDRGCLLRCRKNAIENVNKNFNYETMNNYLENQWYQCIRRKYDKENSSC